MAHMLVMDDAFTVIEPEDPGLRAWDSPQGLAGEGGEG